MKKCVPQIDKKWSNGAQNRIFVPLFVLFFEKWGIPDPLSGAASIRV
jgi:hypothetical protein